MFAGTLAPVLYYAARPKASENRTPVAGFTGQGFNSPMEVTLADSDGDLIYKVFIAIRGVNSSGDTIEHYAFTNDVDPAAR